VRLGIIGFPGSGKTTLFNLLTGADAGVAQPPGRGRLNVGVARVPDDRVTRLSAMFRPQKTVYASVDVVDLAGFDRGDRATLDVGELRQADAPLHVVRAFPSAALSAHPPARGSTSRRLVLADLQIASHASRSSARAQAKAHGCRAAGVPCSASEGPLGGVARALPLARATLRGFSSCWPFSTA
jgi:hypothetical protein